MPAQPLGNRKNVGELIFGSGALGERPEMAVQVMSVIGAWSSADSRLVGIVAHLLKADPDVAMAMLLAVDSQVAQRRMILAAAAAVLKPKDRPLFDAVVNWASASKRTRNQFAHWLWGMSPDLPEALLLLDPRHYYVSLAALKKWRQTKNALGRDAGPQPDPIDRSRVLVWLEADLHDAHYEALRAMDALALLGVLVARDFAGGDIVTSMRAKLSAIPAVREELERARVEELAAKRLATQRSVRPPKKPSSAQRRKAAAANKART